MDTSSDEEFETINEYNNIYKKNRTHRRSMPYLNVNSKYSGNQNVALKIMNRETHGTFSGKRSNVNRKVFEKIPPRLRFCLMDMVPLVFLKSHTFMGFSLCGQFLLSFTYDLHIIRRDFREGYSFRLHFFSWVPGQQAKLVHSVPLFDDTSVDNRVTVSMAQWKHNPSLLVVYGIAEISTENSYLSVIGVPRLGCRKCSALSNIHEVLDCGGKRCVEHNFAIHTKFYCASESAICEPVVQLTYHNQIVIYTDFIHILEIDLIVPDQMTDDAIHEEKLSQEQCSQTASFVKTPQNVLITNSSADIVVQNILADFSDMEMEPCVNMRPVQVPDMISHEVCIQALRGPQPSPGCSEVYIGVEDNWDSVPSPRTLISPPLRSPRRRPAESLSRFNDMHRIADKTYEFVEEAEPKCEKLSLFRKRRLADKKYEFSEDNSENIVPFRVLRSNRKYYIGSTNRETSRRAKSPPPEAVILRVHNQITAPLPLTQDIKCDNLLNRFHGPDSVNDVEYRVTAMQEDGSLKTIAVHDNSSKTLSDCIVHPQDPYLVHSENSNCSKHFIRRFVESDDDITSIITDSEDDCISGYHVALPLVAHGACYVPLQPVSMGTWERLRIEAPVLQASQRSLDIELLCNEVCVRLCRLHDKKFVYCFDWGCHVINVCQSSGCICGVCAMWLWATEEESASQCHSCKDNSFCMVHRRQYAAECLFVWDLSSGLYRTEHVSFKEDDTQDAQKGMLEICKLVWDLCSHTSKCVMKQIVKLLMLEKNCRECGGDRARQMALQLAPVTSSFGQDNRLLTTLAGRSLKRLTDFDHCIEITKQHADSSESESTAEESDSD